MNGNADFQFGLWDSVALGTQTGVTNILNAVTVTNGIFIVQLDFGHVFDGNARWLEVAARYPQGVVSYAALTPRQPLTAVPYASNSANVTTALTATIAITATYITKAPSNYKRTVVVSPVGSDTENGTALLNALNGITTASATNPWLLKVEPGVYNVRASAVAMKPWVDIEGSGELQTTIIGSGSAFTNTGTLVGASSAELRFLTVKNTGVNSCSIAIYNSSASP